jgi:hypothetical protein
MKFLTTNIYTGVKSLNLVGGFLPLVFVCRGVQEFPTFKTQCNGCPLRERHSETMMAKADYTNILRDQWHNFKSRTVLISSWSFYVVFVQWIGK